MLNLIKSEDQVDSFQDVTRMSFNSHDDMDCNYTEPHKVEINIQFVNFY